MNVNRSFLLRMSIPRPIGRASFAFVLASLIAFTLMALLAGSGVAQTVGHDRDNHRSPRAVQSIDDEEQSLEGQVLQAPASADGVGVWRIRSNSDEDSKSGVYQVTAAADTSFPDGLPERDDQVRVRGEITGNKKMRADRIEIRNDGNNDGEDDGDDDEDDENKDPGDPTRLRGLIESLPDDPPLGDWIISGQPVHVDGETEISLSEAEMVVGTYVKVKGYLQSGGILRAREIEREDEDEGHKDEKGKISFRGIVVAVPDGATGEGSWTIRSGHQRERIVVANAATKFSSPLPARGQWVEVEGNPQADGAVLASKIRLDDFEENEVVVRLRPEVSPQTFADRHGLRLYETLLASGNIYLFVADDDDDDNGDDADEEEEIVEQLKRDADVVWAELNYVGGIPQANPYQTWAWGGDEDDGYVNQYAFEQIQLPPVQERYHGDGVVVAVLDTGVSLDHPRFEGRLMDGWDLVDDDDEPDEEGGGVAWGHGTHVSGIVAHIAPNSKILPVRVLDASGRGSSYLVAYGIEWAVEQGADVINLSLGTPYDSQVLQQAVSAAHEAGVVVVAAAGNEGTDSLQYPAAYTATIAVTAVDETNRKASFANYGEWIELAAPGVGITSTVVGPDGNGYASWSGTSMATSFASGVAALGRQKLPTGSAHDVEVLLVDAATDLDARNPSYEGEIGGLLNAQSALEPLLLSNPLYLPGLHKP